MTATRRACRHRPPLAAHEPECCYAVELATTGPQCRYATGEWGGDRP